MGVLDPLFNGLWYALGFGKKHKKFKRTDPSTFKAGLGDFFVFNVSKRKPDFMQGGIQGAQQENRRTDGQGSFWQHSGAARKMPDGNFATIEAFARGIDYGNLDDYMNDDFQLEAFSFPWSQKKINEVWALAKKLVGKKYDIGEIICDVLPEDLMRLFDDPNEFVCSSAWAVIMKKAGWPIVKKNVDPYRATPGDIHDGCYPQMDLTFSAFNF